MSKKILPALVCLFMLSACEQKKTETVATSCESEDPKKYIVGSDVARDMANYYLNKVDKKDNQVLVIDKKYLQYVINNSKDYVYFVIGGKSIKVEDALTERSILLVSSEHPMTDPSFYAIGNAICPEPANCGFPLTITDTTKH